MNEWKDSDEAFEQAIAKGRLSTNPRADNYAGHYMYMGPSTRPGVDAFKHRDTRQYIN